MSSERHVDRVQGLQRLFMEHVGLPYGEMEPARAVLVPVLDRAASARVDVFLETSAVDNVEFYRHLGFVTAAETTVPGGGPRVWSMIRKHPV